MTEEKTTRRKTTQAIKISATWTPSEQAASGMNVELFGRASPLHIRGGRLTINAAIAIDMSDPSQAARVATRVQELKRELEAIGTIHTFSTQAGSVPFDAVEYLPEPQDEAAAA